MGKHSVQIAALALATIAGSATAQIPPHAKLQILVVQTEEAIREGDEARALNLFTEMDGLPGAKRPTSTYLLEAKLSGKISDYPRAKRVLERYFEVAPENDPNMREAAELYALVEKLRGERDIQVAAAESALPSRSSSIAFAAAQAKGPVWDRAFRDTLSDGSKGPVMVALPSGEFLMGAAEGEVERQTDELPRRRVTIGYQIAVGRYEVTWGEYSRCVAEMACDAPRAKNPGADFPVTNVSWNDAQRYMRWLSDRTGENYRLPTEAEWEYAARAGTISTFSFGAFPSQDLASYDASKVYGASPKGQARRGPAQVGQFDPNAFGLHDMHGNVWEWVEDCHADYADAPSDGTAVQLENCSMRMDRGGSWAQEPSQMRSAGRGKHTDGSTGSSPNCGFRLVRVRS
jgi:formylglycine-generating enzyme required for sulfatase activity